MTHHDYQRDWGPRSNGFKHLDGSPAGWRQDAPGWETPNPDRTEHSDRRDAWIFLGGSAWGVLVSILGMQAARVLGWLP